MHFEEALKLPWLMSEFFNGNHSSKRPVNDGGSTERTKPKTADDSSAKKLSFSVDVPKHCLVGCPERIYTNGLTAVGTYMSLQDMSFVTIVQRILHFNSVRLHYGHPDYFDSVRTVTCM